jgi:hypothetical protein
MNTKQATVTDLATGDVHLAGRGVHNIVTAKRAVDSVGFDSKATHLCWRKEGFRTWIAFSTVQSRDVWRAIGSGI